MLSSAKIGTSSWRYYQREVADGACDYYLDEGEAPGRWTGRGLAALGLAPERVVDEPVLEATFGRALHPTTGEPLGRAWRVDGVTGYDLTFSAPKSVSAVWALGSKNIRGQVQAAHTAAVNAALTYLDTHASFSRVGVDGTQQVTSAGLAAAVFDHRTSRAGDPQLHSHALVLNKVRCGDGEWRTLDGHELYHHKKSAGVLYQAALRAELRSRLGVEFTDVTKNGQAEIAGVPESLIKTWSKRTEEITKEAREKIAEYEKTLGRPRTDAERITVTKTAVLKTRPPKEHAPESVLHAYWRDEAAGLGVVGDNLWEQVTTAAKRIRRDRATRRPQPPGQTVAEAVTAAGRVRAAFSRADLVIEMANHFPAVPATAEQVRQGVEKFTDVGLTRQGFAVYLGAPRRGDIARRSDPRYATPELIAAEARVIDRAAQGRQAGYGLADPITAEVEALTAGLDPDQRAAVLAATTGGDAITVVTAAAGTGKTTALGAAARVWHQSGYTVLALAPTARAAAELGRATGMPAETVAKWLHEQHRLAQQGPAYVGMARPLDARTVLVIDEASMCNTHDLDRITAAAHAARSKVVLVGDPAQIGVIEGPGGLLAALADRIGTVQLTGVHRFTQPWERGATLALRRGIAAVLPTYLEHGRIHPAASHDDALDAVLTHWQQAKGAGHDALMMARSRADVHRLNERARAAAVADGTINGPQYRIGGTVWQAGDVMRTRRNDRRLDVGESFVRNGDRSHTACRSPSIAGSDSSSHDPNEALDAYLVTGGFPLALREWERGQDLWAYLRRALADPTSALIVTGERSLAAEFPAELQAREVLRVIGSGERTFTAIGQKAGNLRAGSLNRSLDALQAKRVVAADDPLSTTPSRETRYRIADPALRFWLRFIDPGLPLIERGRGDLVLKAVRRDFGTWRGRAIEPVVRESLLRLLQDDADFADVASVGGYWTRSNDVEVDLIGADRAPVAKRIAFVGSIKWLERAPFDQSDLAGLLRHRSRTPGADDHTPLVAVTRSGSAAELLARVWGPEELVEAWRHRPEAPAPAPET